MVTMQIAGRATLVSGYQNGTLRIRDLVNGEILNSWRAHSDKDSRTAQIGVAMPEVTGSGASFLSTILDTIQGADVRAIAILDVEGKPAICSRGLDKITRIWDPSGKLIRETEDEEVFHSPEPSIVVDGRRVSVSGGSEGTIEVRDLCSRELIHLLRASNTRPPLIALAQIEGQPTVLSVSDAGNVCLWDLASRAPNLSADDDRSVQKMLYAELEGRPVIVCANGDGYVRLHELTQGEIVRQWPGRFVDDRYGWDYINWSSAGTLSGKAVVAFFTSDKVEIRNRSDGTIVNEWSHKMREPKVLWSWSAKPSVICLGEDSSMPLRDLSTGAISGEWAIPIRDDYDEFFLGFVNGRRVVSLVRRRERSVRLFDFSGGDLLLELQGESLKSPIYFHGGEQSAVIASFYGSRVHGCEWNFATGLLRDVRISHEATLSFAAFEKLHGIPVIVTGDRSGMLKLRDFEGALDLAIDLGSWITGITVVAPSTIIVSSELGIVSLEISRPLHQDSSLGTRLSEKEISNTPRPPEDSDLEIRRVDFPVASVANPLPKTRSWSITEVISGIRNWMGSPTFGRK